MQRTDVSRETSGTARGADAATKRLAIVGAGIAGLAAGVWARQSGFDVTVYEAHAIPGGASTSWSRKGYLFEGGMHWLTGSTPGTGLGELWREVGALDESVRIHNRDPFFAYEFEGRTAYLYRDPERLRAHLTELAPEDAGEIRRLCRDIAKFARMDMPIMDVKGVKAAHPAKTSPLSMLPLLPGMARMPFYSKQYVSEYVQRFKSTLMRRLLSSVVGDDQGAVALTFTLGTLAAGDGGYPEGGSLAMARRMAERFEALGGTIRFRTPVERVAVEDGAATGVVVGGARVDADAVLVTQDAVVAVDALFDPPIDEPWVRAMRDQTRPMMTMFVSLGVRVDLSDLPETVGFALDEPLEAANQRYDELSFNNYATYEGYAPEGCTALTLLLSGDSYDWWAARKAEGAYADEKRAVAEAVIARLERKYPQIAGKVDVWDVATPLTYERYLRSYKGSWMSAMEANAGMVQRPAKPEGIARVYFAGQRMMPPGGLPAAVETARTAVQHLCKDEGVVFQGAMETTG